MPTREDTSKLPRRGNLPCWKSRSSGRPTRRSLDSLNSSTHVGPEVTSQSQTAHPLSWQGWGKVELREVSARNACKRQQKAWSKLINNSLRVNGLAAETQ